MSTRTQAELIDRVLGDLGALEANQVANEEDVLRVKNILPSVGPYLASKEIAYVPDFNNVPQDAFIPLAWIIGYLCHTDFGIQGEELQTVLTDHSNGVTDLYKIYRGRPTYGHVKSEFI